MSLIEQLGGYEKAKIIQGSREMGALLADLDLEDALLEYRRQHNIFEEGDWVVISSRGNGIFQVSRLLSRADTIEMEHATDEEIKAGHRL